MDLTPPGESFRADYRPAANAATDSSSSLPSSESFKLLQWNIERGYKLQRIITELGNINADVISLQEVDVGCERTGSLNIGLEIAKALKLNYIFLSEFEELRSPLRQPQEQGGGAHGNAILTKFDVTDVTIVPHRYVKGAV